MLTLGNGLPFAVFSRLTIRTKTFSAAAVVLICLIGMAVTVQLTSSRVARNLDELYWSKSSHASGGGGGQ